MFETRVLALSVLTYDAKVHVVVSGLVARDIFDEDNGGVNVKLLTKRNVERLMTGALDRCMENTWNSRSLVIRSSMVPRKASYP